MTYKNLLSTLILTILFSVIATAQEQYPCCTGTQISGRIIVGNGNPLSPDAVPLPGVTVNLHGVDPEAIAVTDSQGVFVFRNVPSSVNYYLTATLPNYTLTPAILDVRESLSGYFQATADVAAQPLDTPEFYVQQLYADLLKREPDAGGFDFWANTIRACGADAACTVKARNRMACSFVNSAEYQLRFSSVVTHSDRECQ